jgi:diacylglycerol kinase (ATP)
MRVILMHNPSAGHQNHSAEKLIDEIQQAGHEVIARVRKRKQLTVELDEPCDLIVVAGGDGTVGKALRAMRGHDTPVVAMPYGTANNLACVMGGGGADWWDEGEVKPFDLARAKVGDDSMRFAEAFGFGAFPRVIHQVLEVETPKTREARLARDLRYLRARIAASPLKRYTIDADGQDLSGEYFMVEVLNIPTIGPGVPLAPAARFDDGKLDLVLARSHDRDALMAAVDRMLRGEPAGIVLPTWPVQRVRIEGEMRRYHRDGKLRDEPTKALEVTVDPAAARVLVPRSS